MPMKRRLRAACAPAKCLNPGEHSVRSIELQLRGKYFGIDLTDISEWLARKQINPSRFTYSTDHVGDSVRVRIDFVSHGEADLFSEMFSGRIIA
jgi:hypothetical protein